MTRVALLEFASVPDDVPANVERAVGMVDEAARKGAELAVLPELWNSGYLAGPRFRRIAEPITGPSIRAMADAARRHGFWILAGSIAESRPGAPYNTSVLLDSRGRTRLVQRKVHLWSDYERRWFAEGRGFRAVETPWGRAGIMICYDGDFPEVSRLLATQGATILLHPAAYSLHGRRDWGLLYPAWARANAIYLLGVNHVGHEPGTLARPYWPRGLTFFGGSRVLGPRGNVLYESHARSPKVHLVDVDFQMTKTFRALRSEVLGDRRPQEYRGLLRG
jgi:predicted amidohydrolase